MEEIKAVIAKNITELRTKSGMTQVDLAEKLHYSDKAVSKWERAESVPEIGTLVALADLFNVPLNYLVCAEHKIKDRKTDDKRKTRNRAIITGMSVLVVWFVALFTYVLIDIISSNIKAHWLTFICAVPVSTIVWLVFNSIWFNRRRNYLIISLLMWSLLAAIHMTFLAFGINIWQIYVLGVPGQTVILLWSRLKFAKKA